MRDVYPETHWALTGTPPAYDTPDEDVYLHGRNIALLSKAAVYAASRKISRIVVAPLAGNPFPDATPEFFSALNTAFSLGLAAPIEMAAPFAQSAQGRCGEDRRAARRALRADALVHESVGHDPLRIVQQVQGAEGCVSRRGHQRPDDVRERQPAVMFASFTAARARLSSPCARAACGRATACAMRQCSCGYPTQRETARDRLLSAGARIAPGAAR